MPRSLRPAMAGSLWSPSKACRDIARVDAQRSLETAFVNVLGGRIPSLQWGRERRDSAQKQTYANIADSSTASAISGISGVGEKPSSAGARTA
jgi:hypothetical protein